MKTANAAAKLINKHLVGSTLFQMDYTVGAGTANVEDKTATVRRTGDDFVITGLGVPVSIPADGALLIATLTMFCGDERTVRRAVTQHADLWY